jgi:hypothetical protein
MGLTPTSFGYLRDGIGNLAAARELEGQLVGYGQQRWFVDSGGGSDTGSFDGKTWQQPFATIDHAMNQVTASSGEQIIVMPGHAETISTASFITCDVVGVEIIGVGDGTDRPTLTFDTGTDSTIVMSAANVAWTNFHFINTQDALVVAFPVTAAYCGFFGCTFSDVGADNTITWFTLSAAADNFKCYDCVNEGTDTPGNTSFLTGAAASHVEIVRLQSHGDFSAANIDMSAAWTDCLIDDCRMENVNAVDVNIEGFSAATGFVTNNRLMIPTNGQVTWINTVGTLALGENYGVNLGGETGMIVGVVSS